jgi:hypothetical protein
VSAALLLILLLSAVAACGGPSKLTVTNKTDRDVVVTVDTVADVTVHANSSATLVDDYSPGIVYIYGPVYEECEWAELSKIDELIVTSTGANCTNVHQSRSP